MASKVVEAENYIKQAEKSLKTGLLKWKPDYDGALEFYQKAAVCYRSSKNYKEAIEVLKLAADLQEKQLNSLFHAAKSLETAALLCKELEDWKGVGILFEKAGTLMRQSGTPDSASIIFEKGAKALENGFPEKSADLYLLSAEACDTEDKLTQQSDCLAAASRMLVRTGQLEKCALVIEQRIDVCIRAERFAQASKAVINLVLVRLTLGDFVAARKAYDAALGYHGFHNGDDAAPLTALLQGYDELDGELIARALQDGVFKFNENEFAKLARDLKIPGGAVASLSHNQVSKVSNQTASADDDDGFGNGDMC